MKQSEALDHLIAFMLGLQTFRSSIIEATGEEDGLGVIYPWVFGEKNPLEPLSSTIARAKRTGYLEPMTYYNFMVILVRFMSEVLFTINTLRVLNNLPELPKETPDIFIVTNGWDEEDD